jgi:hypothetical protein
MGYPVGTGRGLVLVLLCRGQVGAQSAPENPWQASVRVRAAAQKLADSGQTAQAIAALNQATQALIAKGGPGLGLKLAKAQDDPAVENPLADVPLPPFGNLDMMVAAATGNPKRN